MLKKANAEKWRALRDDARIKSSALAQQKTIVAAANNATRAERIREKLLIRLEAEIDNIPERIGSETNKDVSEYIYEEGKNGRIKKRTDGGMRYKLRDFAAAYKDIMGDMPKDSNKADDPLLEVLKRWDDASSGK